MTHRSYDSLLRLIPMTTSAITQPSSSPPSRHRNHDVFLSFTPNDTDHNFTNDLYKALTQAGIHTFRDEHISSSESLTAIQESRISIIVFSKNYLSLERCLDELANIMECKEKWGHLVLPVFSDVDPSHIRRQTGAVASAFEEHRRRLLLGELEKVEKWGAALTEVANLSGWDLQIVADGNISKFIHDIVDKVLLEVDHKTMSISMHPVGINSRVDDVNLLLCLESDDVRMIGIYGIVGIGKTTIAKAVYNQIYQHFEGSCFLENIKDVSEINDFQEHLLSKILKTKKVKVGNVDEIGFIRARLRSKRVLIVLDDVDKLIQINSLAGQRDWFGSGSRIIITTRDTHLLDQVDVDGRYEVKLLNADESLELFSWHAFKNSRPLEDFMELSDAMITYAGGLPVALEVLGSYLLGRAVADWDIPHNLIHEKLKINFDSLDDDDSKAIFLDIACFFTGVDLDFAVTILDGCGFYAEIGIRFLISRCLLTVNEQNELMMPNIIRDMGRRIVNRESPEDPGKRSRLWFHEDVLDVLENLKGTKAVEAIVVKLPLADDTKLSTVAFGKMEKLRLLQIDYVHLNGSFEHLSKELKWLCWHFCPLKYLPDGNLPDNLVGLDLQYSKINTLWFGIKHANNLSVLNLSYCDRLLRTPELTGLPMLEKLLLEGCTSLVDIHPSIGMLRNLAYLTLKGCKNLGNLPSSICKLWLLEHLDISGCENIINLPSSICKLRLLTFLDISGCSKLERLPENVGNMESLKVLSADGTAIKQLPNSLVLLEDLKSLTMRGYNKSVPAKSWFSLLSSWVWQRESPASTRLLPASVSGLSSLETLVLRDYNLPEGCIPFDIGSLSSLKELDLSGNSFLSLPSSLSQLSNLEKLVLDNCRNLLRVPELPSNLVELMANNCTSIVKLPNLSNLKQVPYLHLANCNSLAEIQGLENLNSVRLMNIADCGDLGTTFMDAFFQGYSEHAYISDMYLARDQIPNWFNFQREGPSLTFVMPLHVENKLQGITFWAAYDMSGESIGTHDFMVTIKDKTNGSELERRAQVGINPSNCRNHSWVSHIPLTSFVRPTKGGETIEIFFKMEQPLRMKCAIHLVYKPDDEGVDQGQSCNVNEDMDMDMDESVESMHLTGGQDVNLEGTSSELFDEGNHPKRLRLEFDSAR